MNSPFNNQILYVIVIYNSELEDCPSYKSFLKELGGKDFIFIWDNSKEAHTINLNHSLFKYTHCPENLGVSEAYNQACHFALKNGFTFLLLLDQDTQLPSNSIDYYKQMAEELDDSKCAIPKIYSGGQLISPFRIINLKPTKLSPKTIHKKELKSGSFSAINSGVLISAQAIKETGFFNSHLKLDWSDVDFFLRFKGQLKLMSLSLKHQLSIHEKRSLSTKLNRYRYYCEGAKEMARVHNGFIRLGYISLRHGMKLTLLSFSPRFIFTWFNYYLGNKKIVS